MIITLVGGGSTFTPGIVKSIAMRKDELDVTEIRLFDIQKERQDQVGVIVKYIIEEELGLDLKLTLTNDPKEAYTDASFIFAQMRVGNYKMREMDEKIPLKHGCVGQETCGTGGLAYGMRTILPMIQVIDDVEKYAKKDHWILNYSNPAAIVSEACRKLRPDARIINICDMPIAIIDMIAECLEIEDHNEIVYDYFGLNHFGWFTSMKYKDRDVLAEIKAYAKKHKILLPEKHIKAIKANAEVENRHANQSWIHVWEAACEMLECFPDYLPNTYLNYYLMQKEAVEHSDQDWTRANEVMAGREKNLFVGAKKYIETGVVDEDVFYAGAHGDWISDLAIALKNDTKQRFLVIVENKGAIPNMPYDAMVEVPAYIGSNGPEVICQNEIPLFYQGLMMQQVNSEKLIVEAVVENSYQKALQAFTLNKTVPSCLVARDILDDMIEANKEYWPELR